MGIFQHEVSRGYKHSNDSAEEPHGWKCQPQLSCYLSMTVSSGTAQKKWPQKSGLHTAPCVKQKGKGRISSLILIYLPKNFLNKHNLSAQSKHTQGEMVSISAAGQMSDKPPAL